MSYFQAIDIVKAYSQHLALDKVSINIPRSCIYGLLGPNGAGKTTLLRIINKITAPDSGQLLLENRPFSFNDLNKIGYLPEERGLYKKMKVGEQALYLSRLKGLSREDSLKKLRYWFKLFDIENWWNKKIEQLSKGMAQKIQFIITVLHDPELFIFDEPFSGFDPVNAAILKKEVLKLKEKGKTIILSTHDMASVEELCDHITLIDNARTILEGSVEEIRNKFKENIFELLYEGSPEQLSDSLGPHFEVVENSKLKDGQFRALIKILNKEDGNDLLKRSIKVTKVHAFREILPSMNQVFINAVKEKVNQATNYA